MKATITFWPWKAKPADTIETELVWPWSARLVWAFFFVLTEVVIFYDVVMHGAEITPKHLFIQGLLLGTTYFAHMVWPQLRQWRVIPAALAALLACVGFYMVFVLSTGRNTESAEAKALAARSHNEARTLLEANVAKADTERTGAARRVAEAAAHQAKADGEETAACATGPGPICLRARSAQGAASARMAGAEKAKAKADDVYYRLYGKLDGMKPMQVEDADLKAIAGLIARLPWVTSTQDEIEAWHKIGLAAGLTAFSEFSLLVSAAIRKRVPVAPKRPFGWRLFARRTEMARAQPTGLTEPNALPAPDRGGETANVVQPTEPKGPTSPAPKRPNGRMTKEECEAYLVTELALGHELLGQDALAEHCGVNKSTMHDWLKDFEGRGLIRKTRLGKRNVLSAGQTVSA